VTIEVIYFQLEIDYKIIISHMISLV